MDELPPAVQRFIADLDDYDGPLEAAIALCDEFADRNDAAAVAAREMAESADAAAGKAAAAYAFAERAADRYVKGLASLETMQAAAARSAEADAEAVDKAATALEFAQLAADDLETGFASLVLAERAAAETAGSLEHSEAMVAAALGYTTEQVERLRDVELELGAADDFAAQHARGLAEADAAVAGASSAVTDAMGAEARAVAVLAAAYKVLGDETAADGGGGAAAAAGGAAAGFGRFGRILGGTIGGIAVWHVALDLLIEGLISIGTAALAATVGLAAMYPAANNIYDRLTSMYDVTHALGQNLLPLHGQFDAIAHAMAPQVVEAYGGALNLITGQTGVLGHVAEQVVNIFDTWIAKIDIWSHSAGGMGGILRTGIGYLEQFGSILGKVGLALGNILRDDPGIARYLLDIVGAFGTLLDWVTKLPGPILTAVLALHGLYLWTRVFGGVLGGVVTGMAGFVKGLGSLLGAMLGITPAAGKMEGYFLGLSKISWAWIAVAAAAFALIAYESLQADSATKKFIGGINASVSAMSPAQAIYGGLATSIGQIQEKMASVPEEVNKNWLTLGNSLQRVGDRATNMFEGQLHAGEDLLHLNLVGFFGDIAHGLGDSGAKAIEAGNDMAAYRGEIVKLTGDQANLFREVGNLMRGQTAASVITDEYGRKLAVVGSATRSVAGTTLTFQQALAVMGLAGVKASDSFEVMRQKVDNLITGYKALGVQGGILANSVNAITFSTELGDSKVTALTGAWSTFFSTLTGGETGFVGFAQGMRSLGTAMDGAHVSMTGLNASSLAARSQFLQTAQSAQTEMNSLTTLSAAAGDGAKGTAMLGQAGKDLVAQLLPAAQGSSAMTTILYGLAQQAGYKNVDSFKSLATWAGNVHDPMANLDNITTKLTADAGNLTTDVKNLAGALNQNLNSAMAAAIIQADGGQQAFDNFATSLAKTGIQSDATRSSAIKLASTLLNETGNASQAHQEFDAMTTAMGFTKAQADKLWRSIENVAAAESRVHNKSFTVKGYGSGSFSISEGGHVVARGVGGNVAPIGHKITTGGLAGGGIIHGGIPHRDSVHALLMPGEGILTTKAVGMLGEHTVHALNRMADGHAMGSLHRMAAGGIAGGGDVGGSIGRLASMPPDFQNAMITAMAGSMTTAMRSAMTQAMAAASGGGKGMLHPTGSGGSVEALMRSMAASVGWTGQLWTDLYNVEMREAGFNLSARNPSSGAYGLAQFINGPSEYAQYGGSAGSAAGQITAMINYIRQRYGTPAGAWAHELGFGWYDQGGMLPPGLSLAANGTGRPERIPAPGGEAGAPIEVNIYLDGKRLGGEVFKGVQVAGRRYTRRNGGPGGGSRVFNSG